MHFLLDGVGYTWFFLGRVLVISYSDIEHRDGFAELRLTATDEAGGDLRPYRW